MLSAELQELRDDLRTIAAGIRQVERDIAWNRVIDSAIRMCRVLCKAELAELDAKYRADQPRVPAGNPDGGQWTDGGGGENGQIASTAETDDAAQPSAGDGAPYTFIDTATGERVDTTTSDGRRIVDRYAPDGTLAGRTIHNEDGSKIESEYRVPGDPSDWNERHVLTTAEGDKFWVTNIGNAQEFATGDDGEVLLGSSEWTESGPEGRYQRAFAPAAPVVGEILTILGGLSAVSGPEKVPVLGLNAYGYEPGKFSASWVGAKTRDDVEQACPRFGEVQQRTDIAAETIKMAGGYFGPAAYGTLVHTNIARQIRALNDPNFRAEVSYLKSLEETYGLLGTVRIDVQENTGSSTVCVYDIKTGKRGLSIQRAGEIATAVQKNYPGTQKIIVIEIRPTK